MLQVINYELYKYPDRMLRDCNQSLTEIQMTSLTNIARIVLIAIGYALLAKLALYYSQPTPVFFASGFALGVSLLYGRPAIAGVFLGIIGLEYSDSGPYASAADLGLALTVAMSSFLQMICARELIRRTAGIQSPMERLADIAIYLGLGGIVCSVVSASISTYAKVYADALAMDKALNHWLTWYVGDALGVLLLLPLTLIVLGKGRYFSRARLVPILLTSAITLLLTFFFFNQSLKSEQEKAQLEVEKNLISLQNNMENTLDSVVEPIEIMAGYFNTSKQVTQTEFSEFAKVIIDQEEELSALQWAPHVAGEMRPDFEQHASRVDSFAHRITELDVNGNLVRRPTRDEYYPIYYQYPVQGNSMFSHLDLLSFGEIRQAINTSLANGNVIVSRPIQLASGHPYQKVLWAGMAIDYAPKWDTLRRGPGIVGATIEIGPLLHDVEQLARLAKITLVIDDLTSPSEQIAIWGSKGSEQQLLSEHSHLFGQRIWRIQFYQGATSAIAPEQWLDNYTLLTALFSNFFILVLVLMITGTNSLINRQVKARTEELFRAKETSDNANQVKSRFLANMSHELRTPMNGVMGMAEALEATNLDRQQRGMLDTINSSTQQLMFMVNELLDFSRLEGQTVSLESVPLNLKALVDDVVKEFDHAAAAKGLILTAEFETPIAGSYRGDPVRLKQIIYNLLSNAVKFTEYGRINVIVSACSAEPASSGDNRIDQLSIAISDTGIGIAEDEQDKLFKPFIQLQDNTNRKFGGAGLGLTISRQLIELMGGRIGVNSTPGLGTVFTIELALSVVEKPAEISAAPVKNATLKDKFDGIRLLVAEDNPINQKVLMGQLQFLGIEADVADDGQQALALYERHPYPVILSDCHMPEMDGFELASTIVEKDPNNRPWIVAITADVQPDAARRCFDAGFNDYLGKPYTIKQLTDKLETAACKLYPQAASDNTSAKV